MELKNMDTSDIWRELFIPVDWDARKCYNSVKIEFVGDELYECDGTISYQGYDANPTDIIGIRKFVKSEKEVINLIDKSISVANKLINTVCQLKKEVNE